MLRALKEKAKRDSQAPKIDISLLLSEGKAVSTTAQRDCSGSGSSPTPAPVPVSVASVASVLAMTSSESSSCSVASLDGLNHSRHHGQIANNGLQEETSILKRSCTPLLLNEMQELRTDSTRAVAATTAAMADGHDFARPCKKPRLEEPQTLLLLGRDDEDSSSRLKPLHSFIRQQIEVFAATPTELSQPAPGRKQPIQLGQVGIRCRHCRHLPVRNRVKRAVCYPSKVKKLYHSVSDMKFAHFTQCQELPADVRATFNALKEDAKVVKTSEKKGQKPKGESSCSTSKYYEEAALIMGLTDGPGGIFMSPAKSPTSTRSLDTDIVTKQPTTPTFQMLTNAVCQPFRERKRSQPPAPAEERVRPKDTFSPQLANPSAMVLATPQDDDSLNPLHCFVRKHLELFAANEADVAAPAPGRKSRVVLGQVGIRCIHCAKLPAKERVKRAVCYPPNVQGVYHAVSNMKFDHFGICPSLPLQIREEFDTLRNSTVRRGVKKSAESSKSGKSSTADYYEKAAVSKGLVDSGKGIRFATASSRREQAPDYQKVIKAQTLALSGLSALAMAACHAV